MDLALKHEHKAFADEIRAFARANLSPATKEKTFSGKHYDRDDHMVWQQALGKKGWLTYTWPKKFGGPGWDVTRRFLFENVLAEEGAPRILPFGPKMVGPVIYTFGNDEQKARFLPGIRESTVSWCQGYSEPGAGSDLANLRTLAYMIVLMGLGMDYVRIHFDRELREEKQFLRNIIDRIISRVGRRIDESSPMVDARLPDGSRVNAIIPPLAVDGPLLSIRRFPKERLKAEDLITFSTMESTWLMDVNHFCRWNSTMNKSGGYIALY